MLQRDGVVMVEMEVLVMMMIIPMKSSVDGNDDGDDLPSPGRNFPGRFLPAGELFSLGVFHPAEAAVSISESPLLT
jgi:hypothetical protein